jgi:outer membrane autotransporter protein
LEELRQGDNVSKDVWIRTHGGKLDSFEDEFDIKEARYYGVQFGTDGITPVKQGTIYAGVALALGNTDVSYDKGDASTTSYDVGFYMLYKNDDDFYAQGAIKYTRNENEFDATTTNSYRIKGVGNIDGISLSLEAGQRFDISNSFYIEPLFGLIYSYHADAIISSPNNLKIKLYNINSVLAKLSMAAGYKFKDSAVYIKAGYAREFEGDLIYKFNDGVDEYRHEINSNIFDSSIGFISNINNHDLYIEGTYQMGDKFNNMKVNVGYRYGF